MASQPTASSAPKEHPQSKHGQDTANTPLTKHYPVIPIRTKKIGNETYRSVSTSPPPSFTSSHSSSPSDSTTSERHRKWYCKCENWFKILIVILLFSILVVAVIHSDYTLSLCERFLKWMDHHPFQGSFAYIGLYCLCSIMMIPGSILTLGAGFVYVQMFGQITGVVLASVVVWIGATFGATLAFLNGRYLLRNVVVYYTLKSDTFSMIDSVVGMNGFKVTFLLRLSPITPYNVFNYFMGLTSVTLTHYVCASVGMIPDCIVYCFIGGSIASIAKLSHIGFTSDPVLLTVTITGSVISVIGIVWISYVAKKEFNKMAAESRRLKQRTENSMREGEVERILNEKGRKSSMMDVAVVHLEAEDMECGDGDGNEMSSKSPSGAVATSLV